MNREGTTVTKTIVAPLAAVLLLAADDVPAQFRPAPNPGPQPVSPAVLAQQRPDLVAEALGFSAKGEIIVTLKNLGSQAINPTTRENRNPAGPPIQVDLYMGNALYQSVYQQSLGGRASKTFTVIVATNPPKCMESRTLRAVIDAQNVIQEQRDDNNAASANAARPCPDLAVQKIERDHSGLLNETYSTRVTVVNRGNAPSPENQVWGTSLSSYPGITGWPELAPTHTIPGLDPGKSTSFHIGGSVLSIDKSWVRVMLDRFFEIEESDETNNFVEKDI